MMTVALDASGDSTTPVLTVAGFVSSSEDWQDFSNLWEKRLLEDGLTFFRAVEFAHSRGQFKGWNTQEERRRKLTRDLMRLIQTHAYRMFGCSVINAAFEKIDERLRAEFRLNAYALAGRTCARFVKEWAVRERLQAVTMVFETGDTGDTNLRIRLGEDMGFQPIFRPKKDTVGRDGIVTPRFVPLQAADWLAYELSIAVKKIEYGDEPVVVSSLRWPMRQFYDFPGVPMHYTCEDTKKLGEMIEASKDWNASAASLKDSLPREQKSHTAKAP